jgi:branched-chain amino acid transport system substrate-binding protein
MSISRRSALKGATLVGAAALLPKPAVAQSKPLKIGLMAVKTGPLAAGGLHLEQGISSFLKEGLQARRQESRADRG